MTRTAKPITFGMLTELKDFLESSELSEVEYQKGDIKIRLVRNRPYSEVALAPVSRARRNSPDDVEVTTAFPKPIASEKELSVTSPMVGMVYLAPEPGAKPFVQKGDSVKLGQTLLVIETMKVMNPVRAQKDSVVKEVVVHNAQPVEFGELLLRLEIE